MFKLVFRYVTSFYEMREDELDLTTPGTPMQNDDNQDDYFDGVDRIREDYSDLEEYDEAETTTEDVMTTTTPAFTKTTPKPTTTTEEKTTTTTEAITTTTTLLTTTVTDPPPETTTTTKKTTTKDPFADFDKYEVIHGLNPCSYYNFSVHAEGFEDSGASSFEFTFGTTLNTPDVGEPTQVDVSSVTERTAHVTWYKPDKDFMCVDTYEVTYVNPEVDSDTDSVSVDDLIYSVDLGMNPDLDLST